MAQHTVTLIQGDGVGPELAEAARRCVDAALAKTDGAGEIAWTVCEAGVDVMETAGTPMPEATVDSVKATDATLKAPITTPIGTGFRSVNVLLRQTLDLYACVRPCKSYAGVRSKYENIDLVVVRENVEDLYAGVEFEQGTPAAAELIDTVNRLSADKKVKTGADTTGISIKPISVENTERIVRYAFEYARKHGRKKVTWVHKANIMKFSDGLFKAVAERVSQDYPDIEGEERLIDNMCMQLVQKPELYDVLVTPNLYGDVVSDLCAGLVGGLGVVPGSNVGDHCAVFEAVHGSAPDIAGKDLANPLAVIMSGVMMLRHLGEVDRARRIRAAYNDLLEHGTPAELTRDLGGTAGTRAFADALARRIA